MSDDDGLTYADGWRDGIRDAIEQRGVDPDHACRECCGLGVRVYGSTATWRGGVGGQRMTRGVCNRCWGSGDAQRPWLDLRRLERELEALRLERDVARAGNS